MKILIAEDDPVSRTILREAVKNLGHECLEAEDGGEAFEIFRKTPDIEVVISDWMMPDVDGLELCRKIRESERENYTFFIFVTALGSRERLLEGLRAGADEYLTKPLDIGQLQAKLIVASRVTSVHRRLDTEAERIPAERAAPPRAEETKTADFMKSRKARFKGRRVWDILISQGKLTYEQLRRAIEIQRTDRRELGKVLVSLGFISEEDLAQAQAERLGVEYVDLSVEHVDRSVVGVIDREILREHGAIPLWVEDRCMVWR